MGVSIPSTPIRSVERDSLDSCIDPTPQISQQIGEAPGPGPVQPVAAPAQSLLGEPVSELAEPLSARLFRMVPASRQSPSHGTTSRRLRPPLHCRWLSTPPCGCQTGGMYLNGLPVTADQLKTLALTNYGHFTSFVAHHREVRGLSLHLQRLVRDCRTVFDADLDENQVRELIAKALAGHDEDVVVRVTVFDPDLEMGHPARPAAPSILITARAAPTGLAKPLRLQSAAYARELPRVKHVGLFGALHHRRAAQVAGFDDVLLTTANGLITEIATSNIGLIDSEGRLVWPQADVLPGTTMRLLSQARDEEVLTRPISLAELPDYIGAIATNAAVGVRAVTTVDDTVWQIQHDIVDTLRTEYESIPLERV
ncbi:aminotransferase class IV family protein [Nocardia sp. NPDC060259]|uniref:aminotransferase class IV family protein n=1 Tax=Nocardia sp. NPDC060259 TaxID=3347088 RepID=UPI00365C695E